MKRVAILQSSYIPWKGYFDIIASVDEFVLYDSVQYTKDWRNRNKIKTPNGPQWLTIPVHHKFSNLIQDVHTTNTTWKKDHWKSIQRNYSKSKHFSEIKDHVESLYEQCHHTRLSDINRYFLSHICEMIGINTPITDSSQYKHEGDRNQKLLMICQAAGADTYLSGPAAKQYLDVDLFAKNNIQVEWMDYSNYLPYTQPWGDFIHEVSIIDLLFNEGDNAIRFMKANHIKNI
ncbi:MAG TPA: WbqC family protein [Pseudomonadales bacterium]|nr:WbqC family protein [Pseudomonadales bacterium]